MFQAIVSLAMISIQLHHASRFTAILQALTVMHGRSCVKSIWAMDESID